MEGKGQAIRWQLKATKSMQVQVQRLQRKMDTESRSEVIRRALQLVARLHDSQSVWIEEPSGVLTRVEL